jgi:hypothetical protein
LTALHFARGRSCRAHCDRRGVGQLDGRARCADHIRGCLARRYRCCPASLAPAWSQNSTRAAASVLHIGYGWLAFGLLLLDGLYPILPQTAAWHALTVGAVGTMTLAVMTRASWSAAFGLFAIVYGGALTRPRAQGQAARPI